MPNFSGWTWGQGPAMLIFILPALIQSLTIGSNELTFWRTFANTEGYETKYHSFISWQLLNSSWKYFHPSHLSNGITWTILSTVPKGILTRRGTISFSMSLFQTEGLREGTVNDSWHHCSQALLSHLAKTTFFKWNHTHTCMHTCMHDVS